MAALRIGVSGSALLLLSLALASPTARCGTGGDQSCPSQDGPRAGGAMIQTVSGKDAAVVGAHPHSFAEAAVHPALLNVQDDKAQLAPLKGRITTLESEATSLATRIKALQSEVGAADAAAAMQKEAAMDQIAKVPLPTLLEDKAEAASLLTSSVLDTTKSMEDTLKARIVALETQLATMKSQVAALENQVTGRTYAPEMAMLQEAGTSLAGRVFSLEKEIDVLRTRVSNLEHTVVG
mmetsp:Transcript_19373/g.41225  ORF Transcript_19373/g.41225 Transcript_19373/m.41225 type:complete len:237 (+) Transcript_19373:75-785(+)